MNRQDQYFCSTQISLPCLSMAFCGALAQAPRSGSLGSLPHTSMAPKDIMTNSHAKSILNAMNALRKSNTLCDITLRVDNTDFPAHRIVLAACSDYFCAMFTSEVKVSAICLKTPSSSYQPL